MGLFSNLFGGIGNFLNDVTGATSAAKKQYQYNVGLGQQNAYHSEQAMKLNNQYQKEFAQNAHQWEIKDLKKAGLNPVLSAGGSGASASGGGISAGSASGAGIAQSGLSPTDLMNSGIGIWQGFEQAKNTASDTARKNAETANIDQDTILKRWQTLTEMEKGPLTRAQREKLNAEKDQIVKMTPYLIQKTASETDYNRRRASGKSANLTLGVNTPIGGVNMSTGHTD